MAVDPLENSLGRIVIFRRPGPVANLAGLFVKCNLPLRPGGVLFLAEIAEQRPDFHIRTGAPQILDGPVVILILLFKLLHMFCDIDISESGIVVLLRELLRSQFFFGSFIELDVYFFIVSHEKDIPF